VAPCWPAGANHEDRGHGYAQKQSVQTTPALRCGGKRIRQSDAAYHRRNAILAVGAQGLYPEDGYFLAEDQ
jgi:hypothetical protein